LGLEQVRVPFESHSPESSSAQVYDSPHIMFYLFNKKTAIWRSFVIYYLHLLLFLRFLATKSLIILKINDSEITPPAIPRATAAAPPSQEIAEGVNPLTKSRTAR